MEERDLYDKNGNLTGRTYFKGQPVPKGFYPMVVMIAIENSKGEFLMQKRVPAKGGDWGVTGGHPKAKETCIQGIITEVKEELGIDISKAKIEKFDSGCDGKDCYVMYYTQLDINLKKLKIQKEELTEVDWFSMQKLQSMADNGELNPDQLAFFEKCKNFLAKKHQKD